MPLSELLDLAWSYPLFEALYGRRSRRFGLGFEMPEGPFRYKSAHTPVPLSEIEEALLVGAGAGFSGLALWDLPSCARSRRRRSAPSSSKPTERNVASFAVAGSTFRAAYRR